MFKIHNGNHKYCNININKIKLKEGRKDETYLVEFDGMLVGKFHINIFSLLAKTGLVRPVEQLIKLVSPNSPRTHYGRFDVLAGINEKLAGIITFIMHCKQFKIKTKTFKRLNVFRLKSE